MTATLTRNRVQPLAGTVTRNRVKSLAGTVARGGARLLVGVVAVVVFGVGSSMTSAAPADAAEVPAVGGVSGVLCALNPALCVVDAVAGAAGEVAGDVIGGISEGIAALADGVFTTIVAYFGQAAVMLLEILSTWWIRNPSLITSRVGIVESISTYFYALTAVMVLAGFIWGGIQIIIRQRAEPAVELLRATLTYVLIAGSGIALIQGAAAATDAWAAQLVDDAFALENLPEVFGELLLENPGLFLLFSLVLIIFGVIQALLLVMREVSLIILTGMIGFAASGQYFRFSRSWLGNLAGMIIPILLWKPIAAMLIAISLSWISNATGPADILIGLVLFAGAGIAYKPLQRLFVVFTPGGGSSASGGGGALSALGTGALGIAMLSGSGSGAAGGASGAAGGAASGSAGGPAGAAAGAAAGVTVGVVRQGTSRQGPSS